MQQEKPENKSSSLLKSVIEESKKLRSERGEDFFSGRNSVEGNNNGTQVTTKIHTFSEKNTEVDYRTLRDSHVKLAHLIVNYDKKIFEVNDQVLPPKKSRSKSVHLYIDEKIETFLKTESEKAETAWGLRKNAGLGSLIQKFIGNFIELKKREEKQLKHIKKIINDFRSNLVEFKKNSNDPNNYQNTERTNQRMKVLSNDLIILLTLLEFEDESLKSCLGPDLYKWLDFIFKWKFHS